MKLFISTEVFRGSDSKNRNKATCEWNGKRHRMTSLRSELDAAQMLAQHLVISEHPSADPKQITVQIVACGAYEAEYTNPVTPVNPVNPVNPVPPNPKAPQPRTIFWISVDDHLPDDECTVLVQDSSGDCWMSHHVYNHWLEHLLEWPIKDVTNWSHLPEPAN